MSRWRIGRIFGIGIYIDPSWLLIFAFLVWSLATGFFSPRLLGLRVRGGLNVEVLGLAVIASLLLFASVVAHELAHSYVALRNGIPVLSITLFFFGGVAQIGDEPDRPMTEFLVAIMGPLMSFALAIFFAIMWVWPNLLLSVYPAGRGWLVPLSLVGSYLAQANAALALFNLVPGFPLDGGRVLRAVFWGALHSLPRATRWAMLIGRGIAALMVVAGLASFLPGLGWSGLMLVLIGGFVWNAAGEAYQQVLLRDALEQVHVSEIMTRSVQGVPSDISVREFVDTYALTHRADTFAAEADGKVVGILSLSRLDKVPPAVWSAMRLSEIMQPLSEGPQISPNASGRQALQQLSRTDSDQIQVVDADARFLGLIGRADIGRYLKLKRNLA